jgi:sugar phosphate isomerase/epimerase
MRMSGFADEAADGLEGQIEVTRALGWGLIELRSVDGRNIVDLSEEDFARLRDRLEAARVGVNCLGTTIANWGKRVDEDFGPVLEAAARAGRRARALGAAHVRIMSWAILRDAEGRALPDQREEVRFERLREIVGIIKDHGETPVHENCFNYGGMSWEHSLRLLEAVPGLRLVYDTGNPGLTSDFRRPFPYPNQDSWECYRALRPYIVHVHVKDGIRDPATGEETYFFPGEGACEVERILADLLASGYDGDFSIEPHMAIVFHDASVRSPEGTRRANYLEYGRRTEAMLRRLGARLDTADTTN